MTVIEPVFTSGGTRSRWPPRAAASAPPTGQSIRARRSASRIAYASTRAEIDFGAWDGRRWDAIGEPAISAWCHELAHDQGHGGESVAELCDRCVGWLARVTGSPVRCVVGHAGWINAACRLRQGSGPPVDASDWPALLAYGERLDLR